MSYWNLDFLDVFRRLGAAHHENQMRGAARRDLNRLTDHQLRDIGIERRQISEVVEAMAKPENVPATPSHQPEDVQSGRWSVNTAAPCTQA